MSNFRLQDGILTNAANRFADLSTDTGEATTYLNNGPGSIGAWDGRLFALAITSHETFVTKVGDNLDHAKTLLAGVSSNLTTTQERYDQTNEDNVVEVGDIYDALGSGATGDPGLDEGGSGTAMGTDLASSELTAPVNEHAIPELAQHCIAMGTLLISPSYWLNKMIGAVMSAFGCPTTPIDWVTQQVAGDWNAFGKAANAFTKIGAFYTKDGQLITADSGALFRGWDGDAAASAENYFASLSDAFTEQEPALSALGDRYGQLATGMHLGGLSLGTLIAIFTDALLVAAAAAAVVWAGGVSAAVVLAALEVALADWIAMVGVIAWMGVGVYAFSGVVAGYASAAQPIEFVDMPQEA
ncbi:MAG: hypothetical protein ACTH2Q_07990 [Propionibacteriaceae bacterium]